MFQDCYESVEQPIGQWGFFLHHIAVSMCFGIKETNLVANEVVCEACRERVRRVAFKLQL